MNPIPTTVPATPGPRRPAVRKPRVFKIQYQRAALWVYDSATDMREFLSWGDAIRYATNPSRRVSSQAGLATIRGGAR